MLQTPVVVILFVSLFKRSIAAQSKPGFYEGGVKLITRKIKRYSLPHTCTAKMGRARAHGTNVETQDLEANINR